MTFRTSPSAPLTRRLHYPGGARVVRGRVPAGLIMAASGTGTVRAAGRPPVGEAGKGATTMIATVEVTTPDGVADAYLARPDERPHPGVLLIADAYGLRPTIAEMADRIAADGYVVL